MVNSAGMRTSHPCSTLTPLAQIPVPGTGWDKHSLINNRAIAPANTTPGTKYLFYAKDKSLQVLERDGRGMLNPHWKAYKATARRYEEEKSKEQDPESSDSERGGPYRFQGPRDGQPSPQTPTPYPLMPQGNYGNPSGEGHRVSEG